MIFKGVREGKPYPEHGLSYRTGRGFPHDRFRLDELVTTTTVLALDRSALRGLDVLRRSLPARREVERHLATSKTACTGRCARRYENRTVLHARLLDLDAVTQHADQA